jgi:hypothetical protein
LVTVALPAVRLVVEPFAADKFVVEIVLAFKLVANEVFAATTFAVTLVADSVPAFMLLDERVVILPLAAVKLLVLTVPVDRLPTPSVPVVILPAVKLVIEPLAAVRRVALIVPEVKLLVVTFVALNVLIEPPFGQFMVKAFPPPRPLPHWTAFSVPSANACVGSNAIGNVITNPELTNSVAKTLLILVWADRCVVVILDIVLPL